MGDNIERTITAPKIYVALSPLPHWYRGVLNPPEMWHKKGPTLQSKSFSPHWGLVLNFLFLLHINWIFNYRSEILCVKIKTFE